MGPQKHLVCLQVKVLVTQLCPILCDPVDCSPAGFSVWGILQARILEWVAISSFRESPDPGIEPWSPASAGRFFTVWATPLASLQKQVFLKVTVLFWKSDGKKVVVS